MKQAVILCGGSGERLGDALRYDPGIEVPKPLIEVGGKPFITYTLNMLKGIGFNDIVLLAKNLAKKFKHLEGGVVRVIDSGQYEHISQEVLSVPNLQGIFLLLNGDSFPIMDWRAFVDDFKPKIAVKVIGRDAGIAIVLKEDIVHGEINCLDIKGMMNRYVNYIVFGGLHIGTPAGLQRARTFIDIAVYGQ